MRTLKRNKQTIYYKLFESKEELVDEYGNKTGSYKVNYSGITKLETNVSAAKGTSDVEQFGINTPYSRTFVVDNVNCPISETSVLWVGYGNVAEYDEEEVIVDGEYRIKDGSLMAMKDEMWLEVPYNYVVTKVANSINSITYAIKEVDVT